jgi:hypothetical protein
MRIDHIAECVKMSISTPLVVIGCLVVIEEIAFSIAIITIIITHFFGATLPCSQDIHNDEPL